MIKNNKFKEVIEKGADNYISSLRDVDFYDEVAERIKRRFNPDQLLLINKDLKKN